MGFSSSLNRRIKTPNKEKEEKKKMRDEIKKIDPTKMLFEAIDEKDLRKAVRAIKLGADVNADAFGGTPLCYSARDDLTYFVRLLIKAKANVDYYNPLFGWAPPIVYPVENENVEMFRDFVNARANVFVNDGNGCPLLFNIKVTGFHLYLKESIKQ